MKRNAPNRDWRDARRKLEREQCCLCGCGQEVKSGNRYIRQHHLFKSPVEYIERECGYSTPCWVWQRAATTTKGGRYPTMGVNGKTRFAHRVFYERIHGSIPAGFDLDHLCRNTLCVNPDHLEPTTHVVNVRRGAAVKIPVKTVKEIIYSVAELGWTQRRTAKHFGVNPGTVSRLVNGKRRHGDV